MKPWPMRHNYVRIIIMLIEKNMLQTIAIVLLVLWLLGFSFNVGGNLIHTLLVVALVALIVRLVRPLS